MVDNILELRKFNEGKFYYFNVIVRKKTRYSMMIAFLKTDLPAQSALTKR